MKPIIGNNCRVFGWEFKNEYDEYSQGQYRTKAAHLKDLAAFYEVPVRVVREIHQQTGFTCHELFSAIDHHLLYDDLKPVNKVDLDDPVVEDGPLGQFQTQLSEQFNWDLV